MNYRMLTLIVGLFLIVSSSRAIILCDKINDPTQDTDDFPPYLLILFNKKLEQIAFRSFRDDGSDSYVILCRGTGEEQ